MIEENNTELNEQALASSEQLLNLNKDNLAVKIDELVEYNNLGAEITLYYPIKVRSEEITKITMKRPTVGDLKTIDHNTKSKMDEDIKLFSRLCTPKLSHLDLEELDALDFQVLGVVLQNFFKKPQAIIKS